MVTPAWEAMSTTALVNAVIEGLGISVLPQRLIVSAAERGAGSLGEGGGAGLLPPVPHHLPQGQIPARGGKGPFGALPRI